MKKLSHFSVIGGGSWGTAIASYLSSMHQNVSLYTPFTETVDEINQLHVNSAYLGDIKLPQNLVATTNIQDLIDSELIVIAVPSYAFSEIIDQIKSLNLTNNSTLLIATKGLSKNPIGFLSEEIKRELPNQRFAFLSGPNFAKEVAQGLHTTATIAANDHELAQFIANNISSENFVIDASDDIITIQIAGIVKNIVAVKSGIIQASEAGENAVASLVTQGLKEIAIISKSLGGKQETLLCPAVIGDLMLTCYSVTSRNTKFGYEFHKNNYSKDFLNNYPNLIEGVEAARLIDKIINKDLNTPIIDSVAALVR